MRWHPGWQLGRFETRLGRAETTQLATIGARPPIIITSVVHQSRPDRHPPLFALRTLERIFRAKRE